eukprot:gnl/TRDRNA2_/TRDRNA2_169845_c1_seq2.p1 gnl/TRDRNA2_/TRDRNA2_169845_c1~~gnl/TRDRNA2_/TRDRNA2_169845_c1_seq2.p1  ORF type:complete len:119 (-),score=7.50 gnl/TRDRNA2_/TRDRNA2_169845_c1_seq2:13-369(-)
MCRLAVSACKALDLRLMLELQEPPQPTLAVCRASSYAHIKGCCQPKRGFCRDLRKLSKPLSTNKKNAAARSPGVSRLQQLPLGSTATRLAGTPSPSWLAWLCCAGTELFLKRFAHSMR